MATRHDITEIYMTLPPQSRRARSCLAALAQREVERELREDLEVKRILAALERDICEAMFQDLRAN